MSATGSRMRCVLWIKAVNSSPIGNPPAYSIAGADTCSNDIVPNWVNARESSRRRRREGWSRESPERESGACGPDLPMAQACGVDRTRWWPCAGAMPTPLMAMTGWPFILTSIGISPPSPKRDCSVTAAVSTAATAASTALPP